jgi:hypothetical protein
MEFFEIAGETGWGCEKVLTERFPVRVCLWSFLRRGFFRDSLNKFLILNCHRHRYVLAYVSRGLGRGGGAVNSTWLEAHASVTLVFIEIKMIVVLFVNADVPIMEIIVVSTPTVTPLELDHVGSNSGDLHRATSGCGTPVQDR